MFESKWAVPAAGFKWAERRLLGIMKRGKPARYLVPLASPDPPRIYDVFSRTALFRTFASVEPTEAGVLQFANQYGLLGGHCSTRISEPDATQPGKFWPGCGESLDAWVREIGLMRHVVVDLLENHRNGYALNLRKFITWERTKDGCRVLYTVPPIPGWTRQSNVLASYSKESLPTVQTGDMLRPAWLAILNVVNAQLERHTIQAHLVDRSKTQDAAAALTLPTNSLIAALWFQLARAVADNPRIQRCAECGAYFEITTEKRADAIFCTPACRLRAYRKRQKEQSAGSPKTSSRRHAK